MDRKAFGTGKNYMSMRNESMLVWVLKHTNLVTKKEPKAWMIRTKYEPALIVDKINQSNHHSYL